MSDARTQGTLPAVVSGILLVVFLGVAVPALLAVWGALRSPLFGRQPTHDELAQTAGWTWAAFAIAATAFVAVVAITVVHRDRLRVAGFTTLVVVALLGGTAAGFWLVVAARAQADVASVAGSAIPPGAELASAREPACAQPMRV